MPKVEESEEALQNSKTARYRRFGRPTERRRRSFGRHLEPLHYQCRDEVGPVCGAQSVSETVSSCDFHVSRSIPRHGVDVQETKKGGVESLPHRLSCQHLMPSSVI